MDDKSSALAQVIDRNIKALLAHRQEEKSSRSLQDRIAHRVTKVAGDMRFVYFHLLVFGLWVAINLGWVTAIPPFDRSFVILAVVATIEALFLASFILITQNQMAALADKRAELDLQISLLAEHEITRLITLVAAMARQMGIEAAHDPELAELSRDVAPEQVMDKMEVHKRAADRPTSG